MVGQAMRYGMSRKGEGTGSAEHATYCTVAQLKKRGEGHNIYISLGGQNSAFGSKGEWGVWCSAGGGRAKVWDQVGWIAAEVSPAGQKSRGSCTLFACCPISQG